MMEEKRYNRRDVSIQAYGDYIVVVIQDLTWYRARIYQRDELKKYVDDRKEFPDIESIFPDPVKTLSNHNERALSIEVIKELETLRNTETIGDLILESWGTLCQDF